MQKKLATITLSLTCALIGLGTNFALAIPTTNQQGDYPAPPPGQRGGRQVNWQVVDSDPKGLNCRMARQFQGISVDSIDAPPDLSARNKHNISQWPVVFAFKRGQRLRAETGNWDNQIMLTDRQGKPWLPVSTSKGNCFVRANSNFIRPVREDAVTLKPLE
ncbi:hypothetical protein H6F90_20550 [Trichocoleus sp. FACHB-591]|uniref:hypothetical protein n=1 Tax=Trichocoleus sp. FACHB-591 TaxID=2692872 RepID=UPI001681C357|nr:hypothetical protein [Trichocoleus sp. FACHB-591]MBD2097491.1 hypothetical protein [Trichocoleus sp. FACHB-591]